MDTREKLIDARIGMLALADELKNISRACQVAGISRTHYYDIKDAFERYGRDGLAPQVRRRPRMPNETPPELVARILEMTAEYPTYSYLRVSQQLRLVGVPASAAQVRGVWQREGLLKRFDRLLWLERRVAERGGPLTEHVLKLLRQHAHQTVDPQAHIEAPIPGYLGCQDTYYVGTLKGVGRVYAQTFIDANAAVGFAKLYLSKVSMTAVDLLHNRVLSFYEAQGVPLQRALTDNGREYCGRPLHHPYELYCAVQQIEHRTTRVGSPEANGMVERFNRTSSSGSPSASVSTRRWRRCRPIWTASCTATIPSGRTTGTGPRAAPRSRPSPSITGRWRHPTPRSHPNPAPPARVSGDGR